MRLAAPHFAPQGRRWRATDHSSTLRSSCGRTFCAAITPLPDASAGPEGDPRPAPPAGPEAARAAGLRLVRLPKLRRQERRIDVDPNREWRLRGGEREPPC